MMNAIVFGLNDLTRRIRDYAAKAPPEHRAQADVIADLELRDIAERLTCCADDAERRDILSGFLHVWGISA